MRLEGKIVVGSDFHVVEGRVVVESGTITAIEETPVESEDIILPAFVNAHTHVGDSIAKEAGRGRSLEALVAPPDGLKHQLLAEASVKEQVAAMRRTLSFMQQSGTGTFVDFREEGIEGVKALDRAAEGLDIEALSFGRGDPEVLSVATGYGASGTNDGDFQAAREAAREAGKPFGIHAGERDTSDIEAALDLEPDHLVHMVHAEDEHLERVADQEIPIVVSPRSNLVTGVGLPPVSKLREYTSVALGTDNVMLNGPSMFREMEFLAKCCDLAATEVLEMATLAGMEIADRPGGILAPGRPARLLVLDGDTDNLAGYQDPIRAIVRRAGVADLKRVHLPANS
ncbi:nucleoside deaminase (cytosine deaminase, guanine deaminase) [Halodesulfurarchaeum formicicum]|uniref:Nucleoside deaminase (Cytosine deaminase, guanine deaminase) n=1 Tax=Halodesulfurarchaeum formicicum TaxID=1873524 RepID=A0A1D8S2Z9_9EURY|nr:amidohydrolase family protein [Halodesulfurarchaeum formicicum]AOW79728.1 nucleoside deaminase (cytosine deaminase, guanine deaminase) [Halodesulfurarchaeum formicicum]